MPLSTLGWLNGLSALFVVSTGIILGLYFIYISKKSDIRLITYLGIGTIGTAFVWVGVVLDFLTIILTGNNFSFTYLHHVVIWGLAPINFLMGLYVSCKLLAPKKKWYFLSLFVVLGVIFEFFIIFDFHGQITLVYPEKPGEDVILGYYTPGSMVYSIVFIFTLFFIFFNCFGFFYKAIQSEGIIRKKFILLAIGFLVVMISVMIEGLLTRSIILIFSRILLISGFWIIFLGLKETTEKPIKEKPKKETRVEESLFRVSKRPDQITEEEVSISKEKKICLVCKGKVSEFNIYLCPKCETFYCAKCARALIELENMCWACNRQIDRSKPVKPNKEEEIDIEISEKPQKKPKTKK